jgi:hypothetical protein
MTETPTLQGGMSNAELFDAWRKKLPGVIPTDRDLSAFAVGIEVGFARALEAQAAQIAERDAQIEALRADAERLKWRPMRTAPKDGVAILVLVEGSDIPRAARWLTGTNDRHATEETMGPGWYLTWDGTFIQEWDGPRYWMHCPDDPDEPIDAAMAAKEPK